MIKNFTTNKLTNLSINTMPKTLKQKIEEILKGNKPQDCIDALESLGKKYRRENSVRINQHQKGKQFDGDRPDLIEMKS